MLCKSQRKSQNQFPFDSHNCQQTSQTFLWKEAALDFLKTLILPKEKVGGPGAVQPGRQALAPSRSSVQKRLPCTSVSLGIALMAGRGH